MSRFYVDVDMVDGERYVAHPNPDDKFRMRIIERAGPGGGHPVVRVTGSKRVLRVFLRQAGYDDCGYDIVPVERRRATAPGRRR